jgi:ATP-dependent Clp protease ATP-binding subunit ClpC
MPDLQLSPGLMLAHNMAANEAINLSRKAITPELFFCCITRTEYALSTDLLTQVGMHPELVPLVKAEIKALLGVFEAVELNQKHSRRAMRKRVGEGEHPYQSGMRIGRSDAVKQIAYPNAIQLAQEAEAPYVGVNHLLVALLDLEETQIGEHLEEQGVEVDSVREALLAMELPDPETISIRRPPNGDVLTQYGRDLTEEARAGLLHKAIGRKPEETRVLRILSKQKKSNAVLIGEAGVGKSAIVESLAWRIGTGNMGVKAFQNARIIQIEANNLTAGTKYRGQFEERMSQIIEAAEAADNVILFIDEIHMLMGAGSGGGSAMDAANILKPALQRGRLKLIGATTHAEYRRHILGDAALERRFDVVRVSEPSVAQAIDIMSALANRLEDHHDVAIRPDAVIDSVRLSHRYMVNRRLPDKAYDVLDTACTYIDDFINISAGHMDDDDMGGGGTVVTTTQVKQVIADMTGIPIHQQTQNDRDRIAGMADVLRQRVIGQDPAADAIAAAVQNRYVNHGEIKRPIGVFLFVGPTGVGKTEMAKATADFLFGTERNIIRLDMTEYTQEHDKARLIGAPPGYVGYEKGGYLTEALRRSPFSVVLIDEIEKAAPEVVQVLLQVFDDGRLTDGLGYTVDARHALFIMTSNLGYGRPAGMKLELDNPMPVEQRVQQAVREHFRPEFLNRLTQMVVFQSLKKEHMPDIVHAHLRPIEADLARRGNGFEITEEAVSHLAIEGYDPDNGARPIQRLVETEVQSRVNQLLFNQRVDEGQTVLVELEKGKINVRALMDISDSYATQDKLD